MVGIPQGPSDEYKARKAERERQQQEHGPKPWYWFGQREPIARFTLYVGLFTLGLVVVGFLQWCSIHGQLAEMKISGADTHNLANTAIAGLRPWIKITDVQTRGEGPIIPALSFQTSPFYPAGTSQTTLQLQISLRNIGHSPTRLTVGFKLFLPLWKNGYSDAIYQEKRRFCKTFAEQGLKVDPSLQIILFPEESHDWHGGGAALVDSKVINYFSDRRKVPYILPVVAVCTNYQFGDSTTVYQTSALYEVFREDDRTRFFEVGKGLAASQIFMIRNEASDDAY